MQREILKRIEEADKLLIGLGEEFDDVRVFKERESYRRVRENLENTAQEWLLPAYQDMLRREQGDDITTVLRGLAEYVKEKDYFVVTTSTNRAISRIPWKEGRLTSPCGGHRKQCVQCCAEGLMELTEDEDNALTEYFRSLEAGEASGAGSAVLGKCPKCGGDLILNNIYSQFYDEKGYLASWERYTGWLQGTLNRRLFILELGVGMQCPSVIRFPFEKITYYNQKAYLCRVNGTLYQLTENLKEKGCSISENSVDWLRFLC